MYNEPPAFRSSHRDGRKTYMDHPFWSVDEENTISRWRIQEIKQAWPVSKTGEAGFFYFFIKEWIAPLHSARRSDKKTYINCLI